MAGILVLIFNCQCNCRPLILFKMSYQNGELIAPYRDHRSENESVSSFWRLLVVASGLLATSLMVYSVSVADSVPQPTISNIQLAKSGDLTYSSLSKTEKKTLFDEFKSDFGKHVRIFLFEFYNY